MSLYFFDTSGLIKRYITEVGSSWIQMVIQDPQNHIVISHIAHVEMVSAMMRRKREGVINHQTAHTTKILIDNHVYYQYEVVAFTDEIAMIANMLLDKYPLRALDAIQLASAIKSKQRIIGGYQMIFVSADNRLLEYAKLEGFITDDPNQHP